MVQAIISISKEANQILNIVKAQFNLRDKSAAIEQVAKTYEQEILEPQLRPEYVQKAQNISKDKKIVVGSAHALRKKLAL